MNVDDAVSLILDLWSEDARQSVCILGPPGVGKSSVGRAVAKRMGPDALCEVLDLTSRLPEDIGGFPFQENGEARYATQSWMLRATAAKRGIIVLDDLPSAMMSLAIACRQLTLDRRIHDVSLPPGVGVLVTGNRKEDRSGASELPAHFRNAVLMLSVDPDLKSWSQWYMADPMLRRVPEIVSFLHWRPTLLSTLPSDADERGSFATPRTWEMLGRSLSRMSNVSRTRRQHLVHGLVGEGTSTEYEAYLDMRSKVDVSDVILNPKGTLPEPDKTLDTPDALLAVLTAIPEFTGRLMAEDPERKEHWVHKALQAISWVSSHKREYAAAALSVLGLTVPLSLFIRVVKASDDPDIKLLKEFMADSLA